MFFARFYDQKLAQASYLIGCQATGDALVVDPNRNTRQYIDAAEREGLRVTHVTETHIHADFASGTRELANETGATTFLSKEGGPDWSYGFADANTELVGDGSSFFVGRIRVDVLHTPGHTPEHISFIITDSAATDRPMGILSGDFVFVGDVGRPDLLEKAAGVADTMEASARQLFASLQRFWDLPDYLQLWPGHGAGSACGKGLGAVPQSTVGYEKISNWALAIKDEASFVSRVLEGQPEPPKYFARMKQINRDGPALVGRMPAPERLGIGRLKSLLEEGATIVDTRSSDHFAAAHIPGTVGIPLSRTFATYAGSLLPYDRPVYFILDDRRFDIVEELVHDLKMIDLVSIGGYFGTDVVEEWRDAGEDVAAVPQTHVAELLLGDDVTLIDVRGRSEWDAGHIDGALHLPLGEVPDRVADVPDDGRVILHCETGVRSIIAASILQAAGRTNVESLAGGYAAYVRAQRSRAAV